MDFGHPHWPSGSGPFAIEIGYEPPFVWPHVRPWMVTLPEALAYLPVPLASNLLVQVIEAGRRTGVRGEAPQHVEGATAVDERERDLLVRVVVAISPMFLSTILAKTVASCQTTHWHGLASATLRCRQSRTDRR